MDEKKTPSKKYNSKKAWAVFIVLFITGLALSWSQNKTVPILTFMQADLNVSAQVAGWISGMFNVMGIVLAFPAVGIIRKWGFRVTGITALVCTLVGTIIGFIAPNEYILLVSRIIEGFGIGLVAVAVPALTAAWFPPEKRSVPMGIWSTWQAVIVACVFLFTGNILGPDLAWKNFYIIGIIIAAVALALYIIVVKAPEMDENYADAEDSSESMFVVLKNPSAWFITILFFAFGIACMALVAWLSVFWGQTVGWDTLESNHIIGLMYAGEIVTCALAGVVIAKLPTLAARKWFVVVFAFIYAACFFALYTVTEANTIILFCVIYVIAEGVFCAGMWYFVTLVPKKATHSAATVAMVAVGQNLGMMMGAPIAGAVLDATNMTGWSTLAIFVCGCMIVSSICMALCKLNKDLMVE